MVADSVRPMPDGMVAVPPVICCPDELGVVAGVRHERRSHPRPGSGDDVCDGFSALRVTGLDPGPGTVVAPGQHRARSSSATAERAGTFHLPASAGAPSVGAWTQPARLHRGQGDPAQHPRRRRRPAVALRLVTTYDDRTRRVDIALAGAESVAVEDGRGDDVPDRAAVAGGARAAAADAPAHGRPARAGRRPTTATRDRTFVEDCRAFVALATVVDEQVSVRTWLATDDELWSVTPAGRRLHRHQPRPRRRGRRPARLGRHRRARGPRRRRRAAGVVMTTLGMDTEAGLAASSELDAGLAADRRARHPPRQRAARLRLDRHRRRPHPRLLAADREAVARHHRHPARRDGAADPPGGAGPGRRLRRRHRGGGSGGAATSAQPQGFLGKVGTVPHRPHRRGVRRAQAHAGPRPATSSARSPTCSPAARTTRSPRSPPARSLTLGSGGRHGRQRRHRRGRARASARAPASPARPSAVPADPGRRPASTHPRSPARPTCPALMQGVTDSLPGRQGPRRRRRRRPDHPRRQRQRPGVRRLDPRHRDLDAGRRLRAARPLRQPRPRRRQPDRRGRVGARAPWTPPASRPARR